MHRNSLSVFFGTALRLLVRQPVVVSRNTLSASSPSAPSSFRYCHWFSSPGPLGNIDRMVRNSGNHTTRVLFCGPHFPASHTYTREYLQEYPFIQVDDIPFDEVPDAIGSYNICVVKNMRLNSDLIARANKMKLIMQYGVGLEGVDIEAATKHGIKVARIPSGETGNATSCAEMAIYLMLGLLRKQNEIPIAVKQKKLGEPVGDTLLGKTVFIMGFGNIGIHLAKRLRPFGVKILATKRSWTLQNSCNSIDDLVDERGCHDDILKFASAADIVVCCLTMNKETAGIVNKVFISSMKKVFWSQNLKSIRKGWEKFGKSSYLNE